MPTIIPKALNISTEKIKKSNPAMAAMIVSRPAAKVCWLPEEVSTRIEPKTRRIKAIPPAIPMAIERNLPANLVMSVSISPKAVEH